MKLCLNNVTIQSDSLQSYKMTCEKKTHHVLYIETLTASRWMRWKMQHKSIQPPNCLWPLKYLQNIFFHCTSVLFPYEFLELPSRKLHFGNFAWFPCFCDCHLRHQNSLYNERKRKMTCALWKDSELDPCQKVLVGRLLVAFGYLKNIIKCLHNIHSKPFLFSYFFVPIIPIRSITFVEDGNFPEMYSDPKGDNNEKKNIERTKWTEKRGKKINQIVIERWYISASTLKI